MDLVSVLNTLTMIAWLSGILAAVAFSASVYLGIKYHPAALRMNIHDLESSIKAEQERLAHLKKVVKRVVDPVRSQRIEELLAYSPAVGWDHAEERMK